MKAKTTLMFLPAAFTAGMGWAWAAPCQQAQIAAIEEALQQAPREEEEGERRCTLAQAQAVRQVLRACEVQPAQAVVHLGAGRCLYAGGLLAEAAASYRAYLRLSPRDRSVSIERTRERRQRVRRWLDELGESAPGGATLVLRSNLSGVVVRPLPLSGAVQPEDGVVVGAGESRLDLEPGSRRLRLFVPGFNVVDMAVDLLDGEETRVEVDWRRHIQARHAHLIGRWEDLKRSGLSPAGFEDRRRRPLAGVIAALLLGGGAALVGVCAANVGGACDASWKQGVAYSAGIGLGVVGLAGGLAALISPVERLPAPTVVPAR
jgi:hypothetical protein